VPHELGESARDRPERDEGDETERDGLGRDLVARPRLACRLDQSPERDGKWLAQPLRHAHGE
jgi:hypothetical protein